MALNKRLLRKVQNRIAEIPGSYNQACFRIQTADSPCGYAACLAGETIICNAPDVKSGIRALMRSPDVMGRARRLLGLKFEDARSMFGFEDGRPWGWPEPFATRFEKTKTAKVRAKVAIAYLDECLKRGKVTW